MPPISPSVLSFFYFSPSRLACLMMGPPSEKVTANAGLPAPPHASAAAADTNAAASATDSFLEG